MESIDPEPVAPPSDFYDGLAAVYDRLYPDWDAACRDQGAVLHDVICSLQGDGPHRVLDAAVGIGTQVVGLAPHGHALWGVDVSRGAVARARQECAARGVHAPLAVADMRGLPFPDHAFDAAISADNAVAHLMTAEQVTAGLREVARVLRPGGVLVVTVRDYEQARRSHPPGTLPQVWEQGRERTLSFQVWDWREDGERYDLEHFQVVGDGSAWSVVRRTAACWALTRPELLGCAHDAGLADPAWLRPEESGFFQPMLVARAAG